MSVYEKRMRINQNKTETAAIRATTMPVDGVVYINLEYRTDRRRQIERELECFRKSGVPVHRVQATRDLPGFLGCALSHKEALEYCVGQGWRSFIVFEDDFEWTCEDPIASVRDLMRESSWQVLSLAINSKFPPFKVTPFDDKLDRVEIAVTASAIVYRDPEAVSTRLDRLTWAVDNQRRVLREHGICFSNVHRYGYFRNDQSAIYLMSRFTWCTPRRGALGRQRHGFSDLIGGVIKYGC